MSDSQKITVNTPCKAYERMAQHWAPCVALMGDTLAMRAAGETFLPPFTGEKEETYDTRLDEAVLYNVFGSTVETHAGRPFGKQVQLGQNEPEFYKGLAADVDLTGEDLSTFSQGRLRDMLTFGKTHILVDYPNTALLRQELGRDLTKEDEIRHRIRAYLVVLSPEDVIGWRTERVAGAGERLTSLRYRVTRIQPTADGWGEEVVEQVVEWTREQIVVHTKKKTATGESWEPGQATPNTLGEIPLVTVYARKVGPLESRPPLEGLAWLNVKHWQQSSDQDQIEKVARVPMIHFRGFDKKDTASVKIGPFRTFSSKDPQSAILPIETKGDAVKVGRDGLKALEDKMEAQSMAPLQRKPGNPTATELSIEAGRQVSDLEAYVMKLERGLAAAFELAARWQKLGLPAPEIKIDQDFGFTFGAVAELAELREDYKLGAISQRKYLWERQRRGLYSADTDIDQELEETAAQHGAALFAGEAGGETGGTRSAAA